MITYFQLSTTIDPDGQVDFIANTTKGNYVNLRGINTIEVQNSVTEFLVNTVKAWNKDDKLVRVKKPLAYKPKNVHDISFVLNIYNMGYKSQEFKRERAKQEPFPSKIETKNELDAKNIQSINQNLQAIHVQQLANKNIDHSTVDIESDQETQIIPTEGNPHTELEIPSEIEIKQEPSVAESVVESVVDERSNSIEMPSYSRRGKKVTASKQAKMDKLLNEETEPYGLIKIVNR